MKKDSLRYTLLILTRDLESHATSEQVTKFKKKYCGMRWGQSLEKDLLYYAKNVYNLKRWIENVVTFMVENKININ
ncbi:MAG TPA: hypothetical protein VF360_05715 [Candidatus Methanoperedens sp.]|jgi:hypothetical protein